MKALSKMPSRRSFHCLPGTDNSPIAFNTPSPTAASAWLRSKSSRSYGSEVLHTNDSITKEDNRKACKCFHRVNLLKAFPEIARRCEDVIGYTFAWAYLRPWITEEFDSDTLMATYITCSGTSSEVFLSMITTDMRLVQATVMQRRNKSSLQLRITALCSPVYPHHSNGQKHEKLPQSSFRP